MLWDADYPWDIRVEKVGLALTQAGKQVHILARNRKRSPRYESLNGMEIHRLPVLPRSLGRINDFASFPAFINPLWIRSTVGTARRIGARLILVRDLPLAPVALWAGRWLGIPVVLDMAEAYPEMIRNIWLFGPWKLRNVLLRNPWLAAQVERYVVRRLDHTLVVVEESRDRLVQMGVDPDRITIVSNTPDLERFSPSPTPGGSDGLQVSYIGLLGYSRGLEVAIRGAAEYQAQGGRVTLHLFGTGKAESRLRQLAGSLNLDQVVRFHGWLDNRLLPDAIGAAHIGIVPHRTCPHWQVTIPNKLFDYMAAGKPVLVSDVRPMARVIGETGAGLVFRDNDPGDFARCLRELEDPALRDALGARGREAIAGAYRWEEDRRRLVTAIERTLNHSRRNAQ